MCAVTLVGIVGTYINVLVRFCFFISLMVSYACKFVICIILFSFII
jgi:hypothetical protein